MVSGSVEYRIVRVIGEGAFGAVFEAERKGQGLSRTVALKLLHASVAGQTGVERRFRDEARMLSMVRHRAIVGVEDLIQVDGAWCIVMECVPGADLAQIVAAAPVPPRAALQVAEEIASALNAAWSQAGPDGAPLHLVHRDVKPQNIRVTPQGEVKLLDFGVARADFGDREARTRAVGIGTVIYMAPERFRGEDTPAGDVYALGVTLFEILTGQPPGESAGDPDRTPPGRLLAAQWAWLAEELPSVRDLLLAMIDPVATNRPTARECARRLADLRLAIQGDSLEEWAEGRLGSAPPVTPPARQPATPGRLGSPTLAVGQTFTHGEPAPAVPVGPRVSLALAGVGVGGVVVALFVGVVIVAALVVPWGGIPPAAPVTHPATHAVPAAAREVSGTSAASPAIPSSPVTVAASPPAVVSAGSRPEKSAGTGTPHGSTGGAQPAAAGEQPVAPTAPAGTPAIVAPATGTVRVSGAQSAVLEGSAGRYLPGAVPPGRYQATVRFADDVEIDAGAVDVDAGETVTLRCNEQFATCGIGN